MTKPLAAVGPGYKSTEQTAPEPVLDRTTQLVDVPPAAIKALVALYALLILSFAAVFRSDGETLFQIGVCIVYGIMYFGTPLVLLQIGKIGSEGRLRPPFDSRTMIDTYTGPLKPVDAYAQILSVAAALSGAAIFMALIIANARG